MKSLLLIFSCLLFFSYFTLAQENNLVGTWQGELRCGGTDQTALVTLKFGIKPSDSPYVYKYGFGSGYEEVKKRRINFDLNAHIYEDLSVHIVIFAPNKSNKGEAGKKLVRKRILLEFKKSSSGYILTGDWELDEKLHNISCRRGKIVLKKVKAKDKA